SVLPVLELEGVTKVYGKRSPVHALRGVSLAVNPGELSAIVGPSGSGKTTLLHVMGTLERPSSGTVRISGIDVAGLDDRQLAAILELFQQLNADGATIVVITHDRELASRLGREVGVLDGKIVSDSKAERQQ